MTGFNFLPLVAGCPLRFGLVGRLRPGGGGGIGALDAPDHGAVHGAGCARHDPVMQGKSRRAAASEMNDRSMQGRMAPARRAPVSDPIEGGFRPRRRISPCLDLSHLVSACLGLSRLNCQLKSQGFVSHTPLAAGRMSPRVAAQRAP